MRELLRDRVVAGLLACLMAYAVLFQGVAYAFSQGAMAGSGTVPGFVLCTSNGAQAADEDGLPANGRTAHDCCTALCQAGCAVSPALGATTPALESPVILLLARTWPERVAPAHPGARGLLAEARGPPVFSI